METGETSVRGLSRLSRYLRILLSVVVSAYAAQALLYLLDAAVTPAATEHYLRHLAAPFFLMFFVWPITLTFLLVVPIVLFVVDGWASRKPRPTGGRSVAVFAVLAAGGLSCLVVVHLVGSNIITIGSYLAAFLFLFLQSTG